MKALNIISFISILLCPLFGQQITDKQARKELLYKFNQSYNNQFKIRFNEYTATPNSIIGHKISKYRGSALEIAKAFLNEHKRMLGIADVENDLKLEKTNVSKKGGKRFLFVQRYKGIPVLNSGYLIAVNNDGEIYYISGDYFPEISVNIKPALLEEQIKTIVLNDLSEAKGVYITNPVLSIYPEIVQGNIRYLLVYKLQAQTQDLPYHFEYLIDAEDGKIVKKQSLIERINGNGNVYQTNPLHGSPINRTIHRLRDINPRKLDGDNIIVYNYEADEASSETGTFVYDTTNTHFDEVMVYYHSDEFESWLINKGMETNRVNKVIATVHYYTGYAFTYPISRAMYFQDDEVGLRNPTHEAAVITHEYMHIVSETYNSLTQNGEANAMDEAYSDYFAMAYINQFVSSSIIGEYIDEPGGYIYSRNLINNHTMSEYNTIDLEPNGVTEEHDRSVIFSGALWDFRRDSDVNSSIADELVLESLNNLDNSPSFLDGRDALKAAAIASGYSNYTDDIDVAFANHEIGEGPPPPFSVNISGPDFLLNGQTGQFTANVTGGTAPFSYRWYKYRYCGGGGLDPYLPCGEWVQLGPNSQTIQTSDDVTFSLKVEVTDANNNTVTDEHFVEVGGAYKISNSESDQELKLTEVPETYVLIQNYPNPFNPTTTIRFGLPEGQHVSIKVYSVTGQLIKTLVDDYLSEGYHQVIWDGLNEYGNKVASGIYIYEMRTKNKRLIKKMLLAK